jgi:hypothetical protein
VRKVLLGVIVALAACAILFYVIESKKSGAQVAIGFLLFIFPFIFLSSFKSTIPAFVLSLLTAGTVYVAFKYHYLDLFWGVALAFVIGIPIFYFRVLPYKLFSPTGYKNSFKNKETK